MERANRKLMFVVPMALALIFVAAVFSASRRCARSSLCIGHSSGVGGWRAGVVAAAACPFTVSSAIGFIALSGVAILMAWC